jgi:hypothetical protein
MRRAASWRGSGGRMRILGLLERRIEQLIEGFFSRWAGHRVQPFEIQRQLLREMDRGGAGGARRLVLPNVYDVFLHPADRAAYGDGSASVTKGFADALHTRAGELGGSFDGPLRIQILDRDTVPPGEIRVEARIEPAEPSAAAPPQPSTDGAPRLRVVSGATGGGGQEYALERPSTTLGRDAGHTIVLSDPGVSRTHARIELGPAGATIVDLGSTNGTMVNGRLLRGDRARLRAGDRVQVGALVLEYLDTPNQP